MQVPQNLGVILLNLFIYTTYSKLQLSVPNKKKLRKIVIK